MRVLINIPTRNRSGILARCLAALSTQTYQAFDILIIDDSDQNQHIENRPIVQEQLSRLGLSHKVWVKPGSGINQAINYNIALYDKEFEDYSWILRLDDDIILNVRFLELLVDATHQPRWVAAVAGLYFEDEKGEAFSDRDAPSLEMWENHIELQEGITAEYHPSNWMQRVFHWNRNDEPWEASALYSACLYNAQAMREVGGWPRCYSPGVAHLEETDGTYRLHCAGYGLLVIPSATGQHLRASGGIRSQDDLVVAKKQLMDWQLFIKRLPLIEAKKFDELAAQGPQVRPSIKAHEKIRVLIWSDSPYNTSGFGVVTKHGILDGLRADKEIYPIMLARMDFVGPKPEDLDYWFCPTGFRDPDGEQVLPLVINKTEPNVVVIDYELGNIGKCIQAAMAQGVNLLEFPLIGYFPVEGYAIDAGGRRVLPNMAYVDTAKKLDIAATWTYAGRQIVENSVPELAGKVHVVPLGLNHAPFRKLPEEQLLHLRRLCGIEDDCFFIMHASYQKRIKCVPYLIEATKILLGKGYNVALYLHCQEFIGHVMDGWHLGHMRSIMGLEGRVFFPPGKQGQYAGIPYCDDEFIEDCMRLVRPPMPQQRGAIMASLPLMALYNMADCYVNVASVEGWDMPAGEAMACGTPVVMTDDDSVRREVYGEAAFMVKPITHDWWHTGALLDLVNPKDVAEAIELLINNPSMREEMSIRGLSLVQKYDWETAKSFFRKAVREVLNR